MRSSWADVVVTELVHLVAGECLQRLLQDALDGDLAEFR